MYRIVAEASHVSADEVTCERIRYAVGVTNVTAFVTAAFRLI